MSDTDLLIHPSQAKYSVQERPLKGSDHTLQYLDIPRRKGGVILQDGTKISADIVVAADGLHSKSNVLVSGGEDDALPSGMSIYRCGFPIEDAFQDPQVRERWRLRPGDNPIWEFWMG